MIDWTICGFCCERIPCESSGTPKEHNCRIIQDIKKKVDLALSDIQKDYNNIFDLVTNKYDDRIQGLHKRIQHLEETIPTCIDVKVLYSDRQARETWQQGCDVMIETLHKKIVDLEYMFKQAFVCVDNSHVKDSIKYFATQGVHFPTLDELNGKVQQELKVHHPSRKHLENKLHEKNLRIKELEDQLCMRNHECQAALNESNKMRERVVELSKQLQDANFQIHILKNPFNDGCKL